MSARYLSTGRSRGRLVRVVAAVLGVGLLGTAVTSAVLAARAAQLDDLDHALTSRVNAEAGVLGEYFDRARSIDLLLAHDTAITSAQHATSGSQVAPAGRALAYLERLYPGRISEACLIDRHGVELARVVRGHVAPAADLSHDEADNPFFAPTMRLPEGRVYQSRPYRSEDTDEWVISNSTPLMGADRRPWAMVHFEVALDGFRPEASGGMDAAVVAADTGQVVVDSRDPLGTGAPGRPAEPALLRALRSGNADAVTLAGRRVAYAAVDTSPDNANAWYVTVSAPYARSWRHALGPAPVAMALAALVLLLFAGLNLRANQRSLRAASLSDELTGLPNRRLLQDRLEQALRLARRRGSTCAVMLLDLDRFKEVNDTLGHHHGDLLLREVARRLAAQTRASDTVARLGGDEFAVLLPEIRDADAATALARRFLDVLHETFTIDGVVLDVEASIGLALAPEHGRDAAALLRAADVAMYEAKARKVGVVAYAAEHDVHTPTRLALLGDLRRALQHDAELFLHYQPKVDLDTDEVHGVEALLRWQHPTRGLVSPADFIPIAEGTGLILPLTLHVLRAAVRQARGWADAGRPVQVAVNLSPRCLLEPDFPAQVVALLHEHALPPGLLRLEITESTIMADPARALLVLAALKEAGVSLSIDDFGTGYSSMAYLKRLPVDELKIDRSFVMEMAGNDNDAVLVRSSIDLGHNLGLSVVAEGVEDRGTMHALVALGCDVVQGYHLARPMTADALTSWLTHRTTGALPSTAEPTSPRLG